MYNRASHFATLPKDLDPDRHRIVCRHFFGVDPEELRQLRGLPGLVDDPLGAIASDMVAMLRRVGRERESMTHIETVAGEYAVLFPGEPEHVDLEQDRPRLLGIEGTREWPTAR